MAKLSCDEEHMRLITNGLRKAFPLMRVEAINLQMAAITLLPSAPLRVIFLRKYIMRYLEAYQAKLKTCFRKIKIKKEREKMKKI